MYVFLLIFNVAFHLAMTNLFIHVVPRLHKVIVNIKIAHYFLIQLNKNCKGAFCNLVFHIIVGLILLLLLLLSASPYSGSPQRESIFHFSRSTSSPSLAPTLSMSSLAKSIHLLFGLPLFLLPGTAISIIVFPT